MAVSAQARRSQSRNRRFQSKRRVWRLLALSLLLASTGSGCRSNRAISLQAMNNPVAKFMPAAWRTPVATAKPQPSDAPAAPPALAAAPSSPAPQPLPPLEGSTHEATLATPAGFVQSAAPGPSETAPQERVAGLTLPDSHTLTQDPAQPLLLASHMLPQPPAGINAPTGTAPATITPAASAPDTGLSPGDATAVPPPPVPTTAQRAEAAAAAANASRDARELRDQALQKAADEAMNSPTADAADKAKEDNGASATGGIADLLKREQVPAPEGEADKDASTTSSPLMLEEVLLSATESFPAIREAVQLRGIAIGNRIAALGEFDDKLEAFTINQPLGFYENYRHGIGWKKPLLMGGTTYAGYRLGDGEFEPWYGERETDEGGEFKAGFDIPLLQNRAIDPRRTAVRLASLDIQRADPELYQQVLATQFEAAATYWIWVAAAKQYQISLQLMRLAELRVDQIEKQIKAGDVAEIVAIDNRRLLATRREKLIESKQKLDNAAIKLSLFYRDGLGRTILPTSAAEPTDFPPLPATAINLDEEISRALANRPELAILRIMDEQVRTELRLALNQRLPELSFGSEVSQDVGGLTSSKGDKQPFKLEAGLIGSVPVQRRKAIGKAQSLRAKLVQIDAKRQLTSDKIANDVRQAAVAYDAAKARLEQARLNRELAERTLEAGEIAFEAGDIDILLLNIYEQAFADAGTAVILAQADLLTAEAALITATGRSLIDEEAIMPELDF